MNRHELEKKCLMTFSAILLFSFLVLPAVQAAEDTTKLPCSPETSSLLFVCDSGIPPYISKEWSFPTRFSVVLSGGHNLRIAENVSLFGDQDHKMNLFPVSVLLKWRLYETRNTSQTIGFGLGPQFMHDGPTSVFLNGMQVTGTSTYLTEWVTRLSQDLYLNLRMKYTQSFQSLSVYMPRSDFATWLGLDARW